MLPAAASPPDTTSQLVVWPAGPPGPPGPQGHPPLPTSLPPRGGAARGINHADGSVMLEVPGDAFPPHPQGGARSSGQPSSRAAVMSGRGREGRVEGGGGWEGEGWGRGELGMMGPWRSSSSSALPPPTPTNTVINVSPQEPCTHHPPAKTLAVGQANTPPPPPPPIKALPSEPSPHPPLPPTLPPHTPFIPVSLALRASWNCTLP